MEKLEEIVNKYVTNEPFCFSEGRLRIFVLGLLKNLATLGVKLDKED